MRLDITIRVSANEDLKESPNLSLLLPECQPEELSMDGDGNMFEVQYNIPETIEGNATINVTAIDMADNEASAESAFIIEIPNRPPSLVTPENYEIYENDSLDLSVIFSDPDSEDNHTAEINWGDGSELETASVDPNSLRVTGSHIYADNGQFTIHLSITDRFGEAAETSVEVSVLNINPIIPESSNETRVDKGVSVEISQSFEDSGLNDTHTAQLDWGDDTTPSEAIVDQELNLVTGNHSYTTKGTYSIRLTVTDDDGGSLTAGIMTVFVNNSVPVCSVESVEIDEDISGSGVFTCQDDDDDLLTIRIVDLPINGQLDSDSAQFTYIPNENFNGDEQFTFIASDGDADSETMTVPIKVLAVNDPPVTTDIELLIGEDSYIDDMFTCSDPDHDRCQYTIVEQPKLGKIILTDPISFETFTYTPNENAFGDDYIAFSASDGQLTSNVSVVHIEIAPENDPPQTTALSLTTNEETPDYGQLTASDIENDPLTFIIVNEPTKGILTIDPSTGAYAYTPAAGETGEDYFSYKVNDQTIDSNISDVQITILPVDKEFDFTGVIHYAGPQTGEVHIIAYSGGVMTDNEQVHYFDSMSDSIQFTMSVQNGAYTLSVFLDSDYSGDLTPNEPSGSYNTPIIINNADNPELIDFWMGIIGDVNNDGELTPGDAIMAYQLSKKFSWTKAELFCGDYNRDGEITPKDALLIYEKTKQF
ncbi:MAG: hypothetical protein OMM_03274 [Candidatus Magnetoglobus multicellularis str. Araruama]|uniref:PKD domain-containing protein n=1 Tax=Candidatus Magnetoglobus multicellularis str. Araruama TaxID=890399 RepID=A0A1V1P698_9BACT|nr:MAG: hypothetical protein OMM_03274 [Candidatus Magnetoglobus multicellularis str. Araruama]